MSFRICSLRLFETPLRTRMPFRYGIAVLTECPHVVLVAQVEVDGHVATGVAAEHLLPRWFDKNPAKTSAQEVAEMKASIQHAMAQSVGLRAESVYRLWRDLYAAQMAWAPQAAQPSLLAHFGVTMVERATIDALARASRARFADLVQTNALGIELGAHHPRLAGSNPAHWLPHRPLSSIIVRHTVGLSDPITEADISATDRVDDHLPQSLEACIRVYGLRHFKIKIQGKADIDLGRLLAVAAVIEKIAPPDFAFSLDGNEQYKNLDDFVALWSAIQTDVRLRRFFSHLLFIEQPLHRSVALDPSVADLRKRPELSPMIIDESDAEIDSLPAALALGYAGTSHKNCKGVCKGIANRCLISALASDQPNGRLLMSGEDLANTGPVALLQDLAVQAVLGNQSVERNGHHYFCGLKVFPRAWWEPLARAHSDLYTSDTDGWPRVDVKDGKMAIGTVNSAPFGCNFELLTTGLTEVSAV
jgi:hypothetical protein